MNHDIMDSLKHLWPSKEIATRGKGPMTSCHFFANVEKIMRSQKGPLMMFCLALNSIWSVIRQQYGIAKQGLSITQMKAKKMPEMKEGNEDVK